MSAARHRRSSRCAVHIVLTGTRTQRSSPSIPNNSFATFNVCSRSVYDAVQRLGRIRGFDMKIVCGSCQAKYSIADEKVAGKVFKIRCKRCGEVIVVRGDQDSPDAAGGGAAAAPEQQHSQ